MWWQNGWGWALLTGNGTGQEGMASSCSRVGNLGKCLLEKGKGLGRSCPGKFGVTTPGGVRGRSGHATGLVGGGHWPQRLDSKTLEIFSSLKDWILMIPGMIRVLQEELSWTTVWNKNLATFQPSATPIPPLTGSFCSSNSLRAPQRTTKLLRAEISGASSNPRFHNPNYLNNYSPITIKPWLLLCSTSSRQPKEAEERTGPKWRKEIPAKRDDAGGF